MAASICSSPQASIPEVCRFSPVSTKNTKESKRSIMETEEKVERDAYRRILKKGMSNKGCFHPMLPTNPFLVGKNAEKMINELRQTSKP